MASVGENLKTYLKTVSAVTTLVGSGAAARIYTHLAKQGVATPFVIYEVFHGTSAETLTAIAGMAENRVQVDCYGATESEAYSLAEAVRLCLQMYRGTFGDADATAIVSPDGYRTGIDNPSKGGNQRRYWVSRDFEISYREATA